MRYFYKEPDAYTSVFGKVYECDHPVYNHCTLYLEGDMGLAVIQQRFNQTDKSTYWTSIDKCLVDSIFVNAGFFHYFREHAGVPIEGLYPTVTVRQIMWALKMKPLKKQRWETVFDHRYI